MQRIECTKLLIEAGADATVLFRSFRPHDADDPDSLSALIRRIESPVDDLGTSGMGNELVYRAVSADTRNGSLTGSADVVKALIDLLLCGAYDDLGSMKTEWGTSIWMAVLELAIANRIVLRPKLLCNLLNAGCNGAELCAFSPEAKDKWMAGLHSVCVFAIFATHPWSSNDLEVVMFLLNSSTEPIVFGRTARGETIFDLADDPRTTDRLGGSYWRDLLHCALTRVGIDVKNYTERPPMMPLYTPDYTVWHHRCLCYLEKWDDFHLDEHLLRWLEQQPWPGDDTEAMYEFASGDGKDSMFEEAEARWRILYEEFKAKQREGRFEELSEDDN